MHIAIVYSEFNEKVTTRMLSIAQEKAELLKLNIKYTYKVPGVYDMPLIVDILLQKIYGNRSKLIVIFLCEKYQEKEWCGIEFRAIQEIIMKREHEKIMFIRLDEGKVDGVFKTDGYIDGRTHSAQEVAGYIQERVSLLP